MSSMTEFQLRSWVKNKLGSILASQITERDGATTIAASSVSFDTWDVYDYAASGLQVELGITLPTSASNDSYNLVFYRGLRKAIIDSIIIDYSIIAAKDASGNDMTKIPDYLMRLIKQAEEEYEKYKASAFQLRSDSTDLETVIKLAGPTRKAEDAGTAIEDIYPPDI